MQFYCKMGCKTIFKVITRYSFFYIILMLLPFTSCTKNHQINYLPDENPNYTGENVNIRLKCGDVLAGTLTCPNNPIQKYPAVILITGSSAHDRDNSRPEKPLTSYRPFRQIADKLSSNGIAVLRVDDRGVGASKGSDINKMTTEERAGDIRECLQYLKTRNEIDSSRIGLIGLSEGASIAHIIAASDKSVKLLVLLSGIGSKGKEIIEFQVKNELIDGRKLPKLLKSDKNLQFLWNFDPLKTAKLIQQPTLIINGALDKNVPPDDGLKLYSAIKSNGNHDVRVEILPDNNHLLLKENGSEKEHKDIYNKNKIPDELLNLILEWIKKRI